MPGLGDVLTSSGVALRNFWDPCIPQTAWFVLCVVPQRHDMSRAKESPNWIQDRRKKNRNARALSCAGPNPTFCPMLSTPLHLFLLHSTMLPSSYSSISISSSCTPTSTLSFYTPTSSPFLMYLHFYSFLLYTTFIHFLSGPQSACCPSYPHIYPFFLL